MREIYCYDDSTLRSVTPYDEGFRMDFDNSYGPACFDPGLSEFPMTYQKYSKWCIENNIYMTLAIWPFIKKTKSDISKMLVPILQFDLIENAMAFKLRWL